MTTIELCERGYVPDVLTRIGIRRLCRARLREQEAADPERAWERFRAMLAELRASPVTIHTDAANAQHYEVPPRFFELCLGRRLKYSCCLYPRGTETLDEAEELMLALYAERAQLADGQAVLELGCGWGSLTLWMAARYPRMRIVAVSNSAPQREHIERQCRERGLGNVQVLTRDVNELALDQRFDRVVSVEMLEHVRNYESLLGRIAAWLVPGGKLFVHIFCHRELMYPYQAEGEDNWMGRHFFTGGLMPAADTLLHFQRDLRIEEQWRLPGTHYQRTAEHWLQNQDRRRDEVLEVLAGFGGRDQARILHQRWRMFWMSCAELFGYRRGTEWMVAHYRFVRP